MKNTLVIDKLKEIIKEEYNSYACGWTAERSLGNYDDCFSDGYECGTSCLAYRIGTLLGMDLEEPEESDEEY